MSICPLPQRVSLQGLDLGVIQPLKNAKETVTETYPENETRCSGCNSDTPEVQHTEAVREDVASVLV